MNDVKKLLLNLLITVDKILLESQIEYFTIAGALLGMKRYGGFIPWDDDIDIAIFREDYEKTVSVLNDKLPNGIKIILPDDVDYCHEYPKVVYVNNIGVISEVALDIFILDNTKKNDNLIRFLQDKIIKLIYFTKYYKQKNENGVKYKPKSKLANLVLKIFSKVKYKTLNKMLKRTMEFRKKSNTNLCINWGSCFDYRTQVMKKDIFTPVTKGCFEGICVLIPNNTDKFLENNYGPDYMTPPPEGKRYNHNVSLIGCEDVDMLTIDETIFLARQKIN